MESIYEHLNFYVYVILMMIGLWAMIAKNNLIKKLIGMSIFQTAIFLFFVSLGVKSGDDATIPILEPMAQEAGAAQTEVSGSDEMGHEEDHGGHVAKDTNPDHYANPLPHVLMLTAIVVGVATLGVALAISQHIFHDYGTLEEDEILDQIQHG
ncbi:cation:proton antiporter subunit C [Haloferula sp.]|uniref:cation:proton antiporter subunit C n=1 Tax=Haloferula sp. TaxID=2497595 RepID=UPI00329FCC49